MSMVAKTTPKRLSSNSYMARQLRPLIFGGLITLLTAFLLYTFLYPMTSFFYSSLRDGSKEAGSPRLPSSPRTFSYNGEKYEVFKVPVDGTVRELALVKRSRNKSTFIDPANPTVEIEWEGRWRGLKRAWVTDPKWENYPQAWKAIDYPKLFRNTFIIAFFSTLGAVLSAIVVAYGFSRFSIPGKNIWMGILMATIILPQQVTMVPTYLMFYKMGWVGTFLPLIVPHFFANAWNVFLLRQFFMNIPKELDEAAMIDGAGPFYILRRIIVPLAWPAIIAVAVNHFLFSWNDFFSQILYLSGKDELKTITPGIQSFNALYGSDKPQLIAAAAIIASIVPIVLFFAAQRPFMRAVMTQAVDK
jgi:multiple sugar transport system permease protein